MKHQISRSYQWQTGYSLIEILISMLILGIGLLGLFSVSLASVQSHQDTSNQLIAGHLAQDLVERIYSNPDAWPNGYQGSEGASASPCTLRSPCFGAEQMAAADLADVRRAIQKQLPRGSLAVLEHCGESAALSCVLIAWNAVPATLDGCSSALANQDELAPSVGGIARASCVVQQFWMSH
ncbi:Probable pilin protein, similar to PilV [gamma proteobacterium HdN1]|nr:Probable pilin protein, similar to PilV [gamma proteobacterium HdN1]